MYKKLGKATNLLLTLVFFLVAVVSVVLTVKFIDPPFTVETEEETEEVILKVEEDRDEQMVSTNTGNIFQHYENSEKFGLVDCNNKKKKKEIPSEDFLRMTKYIEDIFYVQE